MTYCNMYNGNPHFGFDGFDVFLDPDVGQRNIDCDPERSGFDVLVIRDWNAGQQYFRVKRNQDRLETAWPAEVEAYFQRMLAIVRGK